MRRHTINVYYYTLTHVHGMDEQKIHMQNVSCHINGSCNGTITSNRGWYMSAHVQLNLSNELEKRKNARLW